MNEIGEIVSQIYNKIMARHNAGISTVSIPEMTVNEEYYLDILYYLENPTFSEFAEAAEITKPAATQIIKRFISKGYVQKKPSETDKRVYHLEINDTIRQYFAESDRRLDEIYQDALSCLSEDEIGQLKAFLLRIDKHL